MPSVIKICTKCGAEIPTDAPEGGCPGCLLETGLDLFLDDEENPLNPIPPGRHGKGSDFYVETLGELGDYELLAEIGRGGQGIVYRARQKSLNRTVALKVIGLDHRATKTQLKRFRLEAEAAANLDHPCIVPIHEVGQHDSCCYFSMKFVEGGQLDQLLKREAMSPRRTAEFIGKLARAVHYAHEHGILHRDVKPGNILVDANGEPHLTDFGLARLVEAESTVTRTAEVLGTPSYMAPEQARANNTQLTRATDVYGLGAVLYHLLTGHPPFVGGTTYETTRLLLETEPRQPHTLNPKADRDLSTICLKCLEKEPQRRYPSALALAEDLERWLRHEPIRAKCSGILTRATKWVQRNPTMVVVIASTIALSGIVGLMAWNSELVRPLPATGIAVLPFENLSNKEDASFADGVQDDILTKLAKIADLKVISRTSVMQYRGRQNTREIGKALRVSHVLEGSVRKTGDRLHLNAQLVDTRTDTHIWAEQYDRDINEMFPIQAEIAQKVAEKLRAKILPAEKLAIVQAPTADLGAFDLYMRAKNLLLTTSAHVSGRENLLQAANLLDEAVTRDPSFFQAYCQLAHTHDRLYHLGYDHTPVRLAHAERAIQAAFRLRSDAGEAHLARAENLYRGYLDYEGALTELEIASQTAQNNPQVFELKGYIQRRQGKQQQALQNLERAADLDPRNVLLLQQIALSYDGLRRYAEAESVLERALAIVPNDIHTKLQLAEVELHWKANVEPLRELVQSIRASNSPEAENVADAWLVCALIDRNPAAAKEALVALGETPLSDEAVRLNRLFLQGLIARMTNDNAEARAAFTAARIEQEKTIQSQSNYGPALCVLGLIDAGLGRKEEALREGRRAVELLPVDKDAVNGPVMVEYLAVISAWVGDKDFACDLLANNRRVAGGITYGQLKLLPFWDPLRGDPRFEQIVASLAPK